MEGEHLAVMGFYMLHDSVREGGVVQDLAQYEAHFTEDPHENAGLTPENTGHENGHGTRTYGVRR